jgi:hypothetical protein
MTIDKVLSKNFKENPIINYDIFINNIYPYINNLYLNNKDKNKRIIEIFKEDIKKYIIQTFGKNYQEDLYYDEDLPKEYAFFGIGFYDNIDKSNEDMNNHVGIELQAKNKKSDVDEFEDIKYNEDEIANYYFGIKIWLDNTNLIKNNLKCIKYHFKKKLNNNNIKIHYFDINKIQEPYFGAGKIECRFKITYKFDKTNDDWKQFKKILIDEKFILNMDEHNRDNILKDEINILKNIFLDKILSIFN